MNRYLFVFAIFLMSMQSGVFADDSVGRVLFSSGHVSVVRADGVPQALQRKDLIRNNDRLVTGNGVLQVKFNDGGFMSLQKHSEMRVEDYHYDGSENGKESAIFSLLRGGLRALSGAIGHKRPGRYQLRTSVATIGIRGTAYSALLCQQDCSEMPGKKLEDGLHAKTTEGAIFVENDGGLLEIPAGKAGFVPDMLTIPTYTEFNPSFAAIEPRNSTSSQAKSQKASQGKSVASIQSAATAPKVSAVKTLNNAEVAVGGQPGKTEISPTQALTTAGEAISKVDVANFDRFVTRANVLVPQAINADSAVGQPSVGSIEALKPQLPAPENGVVVVSPSASKIQSLPTSISPAVIQQVGQPVIGSQGFMPINPGSLSVAPTVQESVSEALSNTNALSFESSLNQLNILDPNQLNTINPNQFNVTNPLINNNYSIPGNLSNGPFNP